jgi:hypothetical protein
MTIALMIIGILFAAIHLLVTFLFHVFVFNYSIVSYPYLFIYFFVIFLFIFMVLFYFILFFFFCFKFLEKCKVFWEAEWVSCCSRNDIMRHTGYSWTNRKQSFTVYCYSYFGISIDDCVRLLFYVF